MADQDKKPSAAVYVAWGTFKNAIEALSQVTPNRIDKTVYPGLNAAVVNQLLAAFKFLGLIEDNGKPTASLLHLAVKEEGVRKQQLEAIIRHRYADLFSLDLQKTTPAELAEKIEKSYGVRGDTREKAVRFFIGAASYLGIPVSPLLKKATNGGIAKKRASRKIRAPNTPMPGIDRQTQQEGSGGSSRVIKLKSGGSLSLSATLNYLSLSPSDRKFFGDLIDRLDDYEKGADITADQG
jgi:hypothetical protein